MKNQVRVLFLIHYPLARMSWGVTMNIARGGKNYDPSCRILLGCAKHSCRETAALRLRFGLRANPLHRTAFRVPVMSLPTEPHAEQIKKWPKQGRHILAQSDGGTIIVYQAYRPAIGNYAIQHGKFGGEFSYSRMSWIKPNFLWMMYRSGWGTKEGQEITLGLRLRRTFFDAILADAVASTFNASTCSSEDEWRSALRSSDVRLQWDPDHDPKGAPLSRRAIQLGLRGATLEAFGKDELLEVIDMTEFVAAQRTVLSGHVAQLVTPVECVSAPLVAPNRRWRRAIVAPRAPLRGNGQQRISIQRGQKRTHWDDIVCAKCKLE